ADTLLGKRSAAVDLATPEGRAALHRLLSGAHVIVCGYRPGALDRFGLDEMSLAERHPGLVVVALDAWGHQGPWAERRGFDSVVQGPTGLAMGESPDGQTPGALPCQLLDHGTGYLAAAAAMDGLRRQRTDGATHVRRLSLARTALWLSSTPVTAADNDVAGDRGAGDGGPGEGAGHRPPWIEDLADARGPVEAVAPPGSIGGHGGRWPLPLTGYGEARPEWIPR
ncbi:MAG: CoA transferase, partial [Acidimicrobiales bacterium]